MDSNEGRETNYHRFQTDNLIYHKDQQEELLLADTGGQQLIAVVI